MNAETDNPDSYTPCVHLVEMSDREVEDLLLLPSSHVSPKLFSSSIPSDALDPLCDRTLLEKEAQRYHHLVQEDWLHQSMRYLRWGEEVERRGDQYRPQPIAARTMVSKSHTKSLCVVLNIDPSWLGESYEMEEYIGEEDSSTPAAMAEEGEGVSPLITWQSPGSIPGDATSILMQLSRQLEIQYDSIATRELSPFFSPNLKASELSQTLTDARQVAEEAKVVLHYIARGVPPPRAGMLESFSRHRRISLDTLRARVGTPLIFIADCADAGEILKDYVKRREEADNEKKNFSTRAHQLSSRQLSSIEGLDGLDDQDSRSSLQSTGGKGSGGSLPVYEDFLFIGASGCGEEGTLVQHPRLPSDILTSCLTTPVRMAVLWFMAERPDWKDLHPVLLHLLPGALGDKKTPLGQLQWAFTAVTDCIAWSSLGLSDFSRLFREDVHVGPLFRGYLLAERIIVRGLGGSLSVHPPLPPMHEHGMWDEWENFIERACVCLYRAVRPAPPSSMSTLEYREWLDCSATEWKYRQLRDGNEARRQFTVILPTLQESTVRLPNFFHEQLRGVNAAIDCVAKQSFRVQQRRDTTTSYTVTGGGNSSAADQEGPHPPKSLYKSGNGTGKSNMRKSAPSLSLKKNISWEEYAGNAYATTTNSIGNRNNETTFPLIDRLPMLVQGLLVVAYREKATELVARLVDVGMPAVLQCAEANMFRLVLTYYWSRKDLYYLMPSTLFIFAKACYADPSLIGSPAQRKVAIQACVGVLQCPLRIEDSADGVSGGAWQRTALGPFATPTGQRLLSLSLLVMFVGQCSEGATCHQFGLFQLCCQLIDELTVPSALADSPDGETASENTLGEADVAYNSVLLALFLVLLGEWRPTAETEDDGEEVGMEPLDGEKRELPPTSRKIMAASLLLAMGNLRRLLYSPFPALRGMAGRCFSLVLQLSTDDEKVGVPYVSCVLERLRRTFDANLDLRLEMIGLAFITFKWFKRQLRKEFSLEELSDFATLWVYRSSLSIRKGTPLTPPHIDPETASQEEELLLSQLLLRKVARQNSVRNSVRGSVRNLAGSYISQQTGVSLVNSPLGQRKSLMSMAGSRRTLAQACLAPFSSLLRLALDAANDVCPYYRSHTRKVILEEFDFLVSRWFHKGGNDDNGRTEWNFNDTVLDDFGDETEESERAKAHFQRLVQSCLGTKVTQGSYSSASSNDSDGTDSHSSTEGASLPEYPKRLHPDSITLRCFDSQDSTSVTSYAYRSLAYLANLLLVQLDDYDVHHVVQRRKEDDLHEHLHAASAGLRSSTLWGLSNAIGRRPSVTMTSESIPHNCGEVRSILFHPSKDLIMTATDHGHVQSWRFTQDGQQLQLTLKSSYPLATIFARHVNSSKGQLRHLYSPPYAVYTPQNEDTCGPNAKNSIVTGHTPNTGAVKLHVVDAASRSLLCTVHRTGGVELWSGYANANTVRLVTAFETMSPLERPRVHELLSSYQPISNKLLVCGTCSVVVCDLVTERLLTATEQVQPEAVDVDLPTVLTAHLYDPHLYSVGAGSTVCTYDHRQRHRPIVRYTGTAPCVMVRYMRRYPNVVAAGYSGGVVKLWDQRSNREPLLEYAINVPPEMHNSIRHMQVFPSSEKFVTVATSHNTVYCDYPNFQGPPLTSTLPSEPTATAFHHFRPLIGFSCDQNLTLCTSQL